MKNYNALSYSNGATINRILLFSSPLLDSRYSIFKWTFMLKRVKGKLIKRYDKYLYCTRASEIMARMYYVLWSGGNRVRVDINISEAWRYITNK